MAVGFDPIGFGSIGFPNGPPAAGGSVQPAWFDDDDDLVVGHMIKNTSGQRVGVQMVTAADGSAFTGSVTVAVTVDAGTQATGSVGSGACTHEGNGYHTYAPAQAETNGDLVAYTFTGSGAIPRTVQVYTRAGDPFTRLGAPAGASVSADIAAIKAETAAIVADTNELQTDLVNGGRVDLLIDGIKAKTDALPSDPADASDVATAFGIVNTKLDTVDDFVDDLEGRLTAALATKLAAHAAAVLTFTVGSGSTTTAVTLATVEGTTPSAVNDFYNGALLVFTSGALAGQRTTISDYDGATKVATVVALTGAPANGVAGVIA